MIQLSNQEWELLLDSWWLHYRPIGHRWRHHLGLFEPSRIPLTDSREWSLVLDPPAMSIVKPDVAGKVRAPLHRILLEAGIALTKATSLWDSRAWFAVDRYFPVFQGTGPRLRLEASTDEMDPRLKAVLAEEVATGIACFFMREHMEIVHISDTAPLLKSGDCDFIKDRDGDKRPDYFCLDEKKEVVLMESKGKIGTPSVIRNDVYQRGWTQITNVFPVNHHLRESCGRVVIGTTLTIDGQHSKSDTTTLVKDPRGTRGNSRNPDSDIPIRMSYAKALRFGGQDYLADLLIHRSRVLGMEFPLRKFGGLEVAIFGITPFGGFIGALASVVRVLKANSTSNIAQPIAEALGEFRRVRDEARMEGDGYFLPNGIAILF